MPSESLRVVRDAGIAARALLEGGLVVLPTETVYGLGARADDPHAVARVYAVKGRPADHPLIVHVADAVAAESWARAMPAYARLLGAACWPGPLTLVVARSSRAGDHVTGGQDTVAIRVPAHPLTLAVLRRMAAEDPVGAPHGVAAPSANRFGRVSPTTAGHAVAELGDVLDAGRDLVLDGGPCGVGVESTIVDCTGDRPRILRPGGVAPTDITRITGLELAVGPSAAAEVRVPGTLAAHYAPRARVVLVPDPSALAAAVTDAVGSARAGEDAASSAPAAEHAASSAPAAEHAASSAPAAEHAASSARPGHPTVGLLALAEVPTPDGVVRLAAPTDPAAYARRLYAALREADALDLTTVLAVPPPATGLGAAVTDRLMRAAAGSAR